MASLHNAVEETKTLFKWGAIGIIVLTIVIVIFSYGKRAITDKPVPPSVGFGKLPAIVFPENVIQQRLSYQIDNLAGVLPNNFPDRATVYVLKTAQPNLLNLQKGEQQAKLMGFANKEQSVSDHVYSWEDNSPLDQKLVIDTISFNFQLSSAALNNPSLIENPITIDSVAATSIAQTISLPVDVDPTKTQVSNYAIQNGNFIPVTQNPPQIFWVDFFQADVNGLPIFYDNPPHSSMNVQIGSVGGMGKIITANYFHQAIDVANTTYPIKTIQEAYTDLQNGNAYIASDNDSTSTILLKNVVLGYYMSSQAQTYLLPVYVFTADNNFYAYVSAISTLWIK